MQVTIVSLLNELKIFPLKWENLKITSSMADCKLSIDKWFKVGNDSNIHIKSTPNLAIKRTLDQYIISPIPIIKS